MVGDTFSNLPTS